MTTKIAENQQTPGGWKPGIGNGIGQRDFTTPSPVHPDRKTAPRPQVKQDAGH
jgi:hypothetical protein